MTISEIYVVKTCISENCVIIKGIKYNPNGHFEKEIILTATSCQIHCRNKKFKFFRHHTKISKECYCFDNLADLIQDNDKITSGEALCPAGESSI